MKKNILLLSFTLICFVSLEAKKIKYESSFEKAKAIALEQQKPLAILITIEPPIPSPGFLSGLENELVIEKFNNNFINYKVDRADSASSVMIREYKISWFPSFIFLDYKGGLLFIETARLSSAQPLMEIADRAISATREKSLADYDNEYNQGNESIAFLKEYILKRKRTGITNNADLIEKYVKGLKVSDLDNYEEVLFILKAGPLVDGNAYKLARLNNDLVNRIYKIEPETDRLAINNTIIANTLNSAIATKNILRARAVANFTRSTWTNDPIEGNKSRQLKMIQYYNGVNDTTNYLQEASVFYDQYYMNISTDSVRKSEAFNFEDAKRNAKEIVRTNIKDTTITRITGFSYSPDRYSIELNNAAWNFYRLASNKSDYLFKALMWSRRAIELNPKSGFYDTYAHLLYKLELFDEAESMQKKAIELAKAEKIDSKAFQEEYEKIKKRIL